MEKASADPLVTLVVAVDEDGAMGRESGGLPWRLPDEAAHFRAVCAGQWILVGRGTYGEMDGWFTDHTALVLTHSGPSVKPPGRPVGSVAEAIGTARAGGARQLVVIGGAMVFAAALPSAGRLWFTRVHGHSGGDVFFPTVDWSQWREMSRLSHSADDCHAHAFTIHGFERIEPPPASQP